MNVIHYTAVCHLLNIHFSFQSSFNYEKMLTVEHCAALLQFATQRNSIIWLLFQQQVHVQASQQQNSVVFVPCIARQMDQLAIALLLNSRVVNATLNQRRNSGQEEHHQRMRQGMTGQDRTGPGESIVRVQWINNGPSCFWRIAISSSRGSNYIRAALTHQILLMDELEEKIS